MAGLLLYMSMLAVFVFEGFGLVGSAERPCVLRMVCMDRLVESDIGYFFTSSVFHKSQ